MGRYITEPKTQQWDPSWNKHWHCLEPGQVAALLKAAATSIAKRGTKDFIFGELGVKEKMVCDCVDKEIEA